MNTDSMSGLSDASVQTSRVSCANFDESGNTVVTGKAGTVFIARERGYCRVVVITTPNQAFDNVGIHGEDPASLGPELQ